MNTIRHTLTLVALLAAVPQLPAFDVAKAVPADTMLFGRVRADAVRSSTLGAAMLLEHNQAYTGVRDFFNSIMAIDLDTVTAIWLLSSEKDTGVIVCEGSFDAKQVRELFGQLPNVTEVPAGKCHYAARYFDENEQRMKILAVLDAAAVAVGDEPSMKAFLDVIDGRGQRLSADSPGVRAVAESAADLAVTMLGDLANWDDFDPNVARLIHSVLLTATVDQDLAMELRLDIIDAEQAEGVEHVLKGLLIIKLADDQKPLPGWLRKVGRTFTITRSGTVVTARGRMAGNALLAALPARQ
jgi:hypothetical protein